MKLIRDCVAIPKVLVFMCFIVHESYGGQLYEKRENLVPTGREITSLTVPVYGHCALQCYKDPTCHWFVVFANTNMCSMFNCTEIQRLTQSQGATSYMKGEILCNVFLLLKMVVI